MAFGCIGVTFDTIINNNERCQVAQFELGGPRMELFPSPENFRAEMGKHRLTRKAVCDIIGMHLSLFSMYTNGTRPLTAWAAHNIGYGINRAVGFKVFTVNMDLGVVPAPVGPPTNEERKEISTAPKTPRVFIGRLPVKPRKRRGRKRLPA